MVFTFRVKVFFGLLEPEGDNTAIFQNVGKYLQNHIIINFCYFRDFYLFLGQKSEYISFAITPNGLG
jgi:hypothetical protein